MAGDRQEFLLPTVDEAATRATIVRWLVELGDRVLVDHPVCLVDVGVDGGERLLELTSPFAGRVVALGAGTGDVLDVGQILLTVENRDGDQQHSPLVRRLADEFGVDLATVAGTGPDGRITRADVQRAAFPDDPLPGADPDEQQPAARAATDTTAGGAPSDDRRVGGARTSPAGTEPVGDRPDPAPSDPAGGRFSASITAEASQLLRAHERLADGQDGPVAIDALLVRIVAMAIRDLPRFDADDRPTRIGFARLSDNRIIDAAVAAPHELSLVDLDRRMHELTVAAVADPEAADAGDEPPAVTIVDAGALGLTTMAPVLSSGAAVTIAFGRAEPLPRIVDGALYNGWMLTATGAFDPATVDVALASLLLRRVRLYVEDPILAFAG